MTLLRIAAGLALNGAPEHRWRRVSVFASALVFLTLLLGAGSIVALMGREADRSTARIAILADTTSDTDLFLLVRPDDWRGETVLVAWLLPVSAAAHTVLPPGLSRLPPPGETVVSPALDRLAAQHPELAARYPHRTVIAADGVRSGGELFAYASPGPGRGLGEAEEAIRIEDGQFVGDGPMFRIGRFGAPAGAAGYLRLGEAEPVPLGPALGGLSAGLALPALLILAVGAAAASETRERRFAVLRALGARTRTVGALSVLETLLLAVPALLTAGIVWALVTPRLSTVPVVGYQVVPGDLTLPWWALLALLLAGTVVTAAVAALLAMVTTRRQGRPRPSPGRTRLLAIRVVPIGLAATAFVLGRMIGGYSQSDFYLIGVVLAVAGVPAVVPVVLRGAGRLLAQARAVSVHLAARGMEWAPTRAARPFVAGAALLFLVLAGSGYVAVSRETEELPGPATSGAATVEWQDPTPGDLDRLRAAFGSGTVVAFSDGEEHPSHGGAAEPDQEGHLQIGATCSELAAHLPNDACDPGSPLALPPAMASAVSAWLAQSVHGQVGEVELVPPSAVVDSGSALLLDRQPVAQVDERARNAAMAVVPAPYVRSAFSAATRESPLVPWLIGTLVLATGGLGFACLVALVDRLLGMGAAHRRLVNLGISRPRLAGLHAWTFGLPYALVLVLGFAAGLAVCAVVLLPSSPMPATAIGLTAALGAAFGLLGCAGVAWLGTRSAFTDRD